MQMREHRQEIIKTFREAANELYKNTQEQINALRQTWETNSLTPAVTAIDQIIKTRQEHQEWQSQFKQLKADLQQLIRSIHRTTEGATK